MLLTECSALSRCSLNKKPPDYHTVGFHPEQGRQEMELSFISSCCCAGEGFSVPTVKQKGINMGVLDLMVQVGCGAHKEAGQEPGQLGRWRPMGGMEQNFFPWKDVGTQRVPGTTFPP